MEIDVDKLRSYLIEHVGCATFSVFPAAIVDLVDIQQANGLELCKIAEKLGVDLRAFEVC